MLRETEHLIPGRQRIAASAELSETSLAATPDSMRNENESLRGVVFLSVSVVSKTVMSGLVVMDSERTTEHGSMLNEDSSAKDGPSTRYPWDGLSAKLREAPSVTPRSTEETLDANTDVAVRTARSTMQSDLDVFMFQSPLGGGGIGCCSTRMQRKGAGPAPDNRMDTGKFLYYRACVCRSIDKLRDTRRGGWRKGTMEKKKKSAPERAVKDRFVICGFRPLICRSC